MAAILSVTFGPLTKEQIADAQRVIDAIESDLDRWHSSDIDDYIQLFTPRVETPFGQALAIICTKINDWIAGDQLFLSTRNEQTHAIIELENTDGGATAAAVINDEECTVMRALAECETVVQWDETGYGGARSNGTSMLFVPGMTRPLLRHADTDGTDSAYIDRETMQAMIERGIDVEKMQQWAVVSTRAHEIAADPNLIAQASELAELSLLA